MSNETHFSIYETQFVEEAQQLLSSDDTELYSIDQAMTRVGASWLGYEIPDDHFIDSKDRGIDFWYLSEGELQVFQVKTHIPDGHKLNLKNFGNDGITDLYRARDFLIQSLEGQIETTNDQLLHLVDEWQDVVLTQAEKIKFEESVVTSTP